MQKIDVDFNTIAPKILNADCCQFTTFRVLM